MPLRTLSLMLQLWSTQAAYFGFPFMLDSHAIHLSVQGIYPMDKISLN